MKKFAALVLGAALLTTLSAPASAATITPDGYDIEPNNSYAEAASVPVVYFSALGLKIHAAAFDGYLPTTSDVDWFKLDMTRASTSSSVSVTMNVPGGVDYDFVLYKDVNGSLSYVGEGSNSGYGAAESWVAGGLGIGTYYFKVFTKGGANAASPYSVNIKL